MTTFTTTSFLSPSFIHSNFGYPVVTAIDDTQADLLKQLHESDQFNELLHQLPLADGDGNILYENDPCGNPRLSILLDNGKRKVIHHRELLNCLTSYELELISKIINPFHETSSARSTSPASTRLNTPETGSPHSSNAHKKNSAYFEDVPSQTHQSHGCSLCDKMLEIVKNQGDKQHEVILELIKRTGSVPQVALHAAPLEQVASHQSELQALRQQLKLQGDKIEEITVSLTQKEAQMRGKDRASESEIEQLRLDRDRLANTLTEQSEQLKLMQAAKISVDEQQNHLTKILKVKEHELNAAKVLETQLLQRIDEAFEELEFMETVVEDSDYDRQNLHAKISLLENQREIQDLSHLKSANQKENYIQVLLHKIELHQKQIDEMQVSLRESQVANQTPQLKLKITQLQANLQLAKEEGSQLRRDLVEAKNLIQASTGRQAELQLALQTTQAESTAKVLAFEKQICDLRTHLEMQIRSKTNLEADQKELENYILKLADELESVKSQAAADIADLQTQLNDEHQNVNYIEFLLQRNDEFQEQIDQTNRSVQKPQVADQSALLQKHNASLHARLKLAENESSQLKRDLIVVKNALRASGERQTELKRALKTTHAENDAKMAILEGQIRTLSFQLEVENQSQENLVFNRSELEAVNLRLTNELEKVKPESATEVAALNIQLKDEEQKRVAFKLAVEAIERLNQQLKEKLAIASRNKISDHNELKAIQAQLAAANAQLAEIQEKLTEKQQSTQILQDKFDEAQSLIELSKQKQQPAKASSSPNLAYDQINRSAELIEEKLKKLYELANVEPQSDKS